MTETKKTKKIVSRGQSRKFPKSKAKKGQNGKKEIYI